MASGPYLGFSAGLSIMHDGELNLPNYKTIPTNYNTGFGVNLCGGYDFKGDNNNNDFGSYRVEGEFGLKNASLNGLYVSGSDIPAVKFTTLGFLLNGFYDIKTNFPVAPYVGAGLGVIRGELDIQGTKNSDTVFGYQVIIGGAIDFGKNLLLDISYRFQGTGSNFSNSNMNLSYSSSNIMAGFRYNF
jgi:opacity protein-like surface antigen